MKTKTNIVLNDGIITISGDFTFIVLAKNIREILVSTEDGVCTVGIGFKAKDPTSRILFSIPKNEFSPFIKKFEKIMQDLGFVPDDMKLTEVKKPAKKRASKKSKK